MKPKLSEYFVDHPEMNAMWSPKNDPSLLDKTLGSTIKALWICPVCHQDSLLPIEKKIKNPQRCSTCNGSKVVPGVNDLCTTHPEIAQEWSKKNAQNPSEVKYSAAIYVDWDCPNGHEYNLYLPERTRNDRKSRGCPICTNEEYRERRKNTAGSRSIVSGNGSEEMQRMFVKSMGKIAYPGPKSRINCLWKCDNGHEWKCPPAKFVGCEICHPPSHNHSGRSSLVKVSNSIITTHPQIKEMWNDDRDPETLTQGSAYKAQWKCPLNPAHEWNAYVYSVLRSIDKGHKACPRCSSMVSLAEEKIADVIKNAVEPHGFTVLTSHRQLIYPYEVDIYIPENKVAIEYNGLYWHSDANKKNRDRRYHYEKWKRCAEKGVQLITIWEDDWRDHEDIVTSMLLTKLGVSDAQKVNARDCVIVESSYTDSSEFLDAHHIQGSARGSFYLSLLHDGVMVATSVWMKRGSDLVLERYATSVSVRGGMGKLLKAGCIEGRQRGAQRVVTFADHGVSDGGLYESLGFVADKVLKPDYAYVVDGDRKHKFNYRLKRFKNDPALRYVDGLSESQLAELNEIPRVWDCGKTRYVMGL